MRTYLAGSIEHLAAAGAEIAALTGITPHIVWEELECGVVKAESQQRVRGIVAWMAQEEGIQAVVLGCTELPLLFADMQDCPVPQLDVLRIHLDALVERILK